MTDKGPERQPSVCPSLAESALWPPKPLGCSSTVEFEGSAFAAATGASLLTSAVEGQGCQQTLGCLKELLQPKTLFQNQVEVMYDELSIYLIWIILQAAENALHIRSRHHL